MTKSRGGNRLFPRDGAARSHSGHQRLWRDAALRALSDVRRRASIARARRHGRRTLAGRQLRHVARYGRLLGHGVDARRRDEAALGRSGAYTGVALGDVVVRDTGAYFIAPKRLSNEFDCTIGAEPETCASLAAAGAGASLTEGLSA